MDKGKIIRIPEEDVRLNEFEVAILQTATFQRLFHLKQLGLAYMVYPFATHTRAAHSIQTLHEAMRLMRALRANDCRITIAEEENVRVAALLHDISHIPFSHTLEDEHVVLPKHDAVHGEKHLGRLYVLLDRLAEELDHPGAKTRLEGAREILRAVCTKQKQNWQSDIIGSTVCADLLAYIQADALFTGISKRPGHYRIYQYFTIQSNRLCIKITKKGAIRTDVISAIMDILDMRYALTERVIFHHAKCVASAMLARAARLADLREPPLIEAGQHFPRLYCVGEEGFFDFLEEEARQSMQGNAEAVGLLLNYLRARRLYKRIYKIGWQTVQPRQEVFLAGHETFFDKWRRREEVEHLLSSIEDQITIPRGSLVLWCPDGNAGMKLAKSNVTWDQVSHQGSSMPSPPLPLNNPAIAGIFPGIHSRVLAIQEQYRALWTFWVAVAPEFVHKSVAIRDLLKQALGVDCDPYFLKSHPDHFQQPSLPYE